MKTSQTVLITGGAGYIGSILAGDLLDAGYSVTVVDNFMYRQTSLNHLVSNPRFRVVRGDVRVESVIREALADSDIVIPLAALVGAPICSQDPVGATSTNFEAIRLMLTLVSRDQLIIMPTTNSAYGTGDASNLCTESSPLRPVSHYAKEKVAVESLLMENANAISFRLATVFGVSPRMRIDLLVNDFTYRAVNDRFVVLFEGDFKRNYIHVRDVSRAFIHGITNHSKMRGQIYNVGLSDANISKRELCERIRLQVPDFVFLDAPVGRDPDQRNYIVSNEKVEATGFLPRFSIDAGIAELIKGYAMIRNSSHSNV